MQLRYFVKQVFTIAAGCLLCLLALFFVLIYGISIVTSRGPSQVATNSVLTVNMDGHIAESMPGSLLRGNTSSINASVLREAIGQAAQDKRMCAIYLNCSYINASWAALEEIREALLAFKNKGKTVIAYGDYFTQKAYYLASVAHEIILPPSSTFDFKGFSATIYFYTKLFEKLSIKPLIFRIGNCKDAVEPFFLTQMSQESKKQTEAYMTSLYEHFLAKISVARDIAVSDLKQHADNLSAVESNDALRAGLITRIGYQTDIKKILKDQFKSPSYITYKEYNRLQPLSTPAKADKIAVLITEGQIVPGSNSPGYIGAHEVVKILKEIEEDSAIKALVLRINSPGGSALHSDIIWKAIEEVKAVKPVVASMAGVAASGGYYIAAPCHYIFAQPNTITGSIGIFGLLFDPSVLVNKIGIDVDVVKTAPSADFLYSRFTPSDVESKCMYKSLQESYNQFLNRVATGRGLSIKDVEPLAGGRVYTGLVAQSNGLVDELGGLEAAIAKAASLANLNQKYGVCYLPRSKTKLQQLISYTRGDSQVNLLNTCLEQHPILHHLSDLNRYHTLSKPYLVQAMLPYTVSID